MLSEIKNLSPEKKQHLIAVGMGTVIVLVVVYLLLITPTLEALKKLGAQAAEAEKKFTEADRLVKRTAMVQEDYERLSAHLNNIEASMATGDLVQWIRSTEIKFRAQAPYKVEIPNFPFRGQGDMAMIPEFPYKAASYTFSGTAYYHDLGKYLADWENQFPYMRVLSLEMVPDEPAGVTSASDERERLSFNFEVSALVKPPKRN